MLNMGFIDDIKRILTYLSKDHQTLMFSATMPREIKVLAKSIMKDQEEISLAISKPAEGVHQQVFLCYDNQKAQLLRHLLEDRKDYDSIIVFSGTKEKVGEIVRVLKQSGIHSKGISSNLEQSEREEVLRDFKSKRLRVLIATDVMSRGIDVKEINLVINYDVPRDAEDYVHRIGRTARGDAKGEAITFVSPKDMNAFYKIEKLIEAEIQKKFPPKELGRGPNWNPEKKKKKSQNSKRGKGFKSSNWKKRNHPKKRN